jgi:dephospho-CoA kinase
MPIAKKIQKADILLENGGTVEELKEKLSNLIKNF